MDFTIEKYRNILEALKSQDYVFQTFREFIENKNAQKVIILRHDIERTQQNALKMAGLECEMGIQATYFFRSRRHRFKEEIIKKIESSGHEIGYHYENLSDSSGDFEKAILSFSKTLENFRKIANVKSICMHGSPLSKYNNQDLWRNYNFKDFGIIGEPYLSIDYNKVAYFTDAGRKWNNEKVNFRDKVHSSMHFKINNSDDMIKLINSKDAPSSIMINIHPHNWAFSSFEWNKIYFWQGLKNTIKIIIRSIDKRN